MTPRLRRKAFGTRVVEQIIQHKLEGNGYFGWRTEGLVCRLNLDVTIEF